VRQIVRLPLIVSVVFFFILVDRNADCGMVEIDEDGNPSIWSHERWPLDLFHRVGLAFLLSTKSGELLPYPYRIISNLCSFFAFEAGGNIGLSYAFGERCEAYNPSLQWSSTATARILPVPSACR
jgi:hypothetical protein